MELDPTLADTMNKDPVPELTRKHFEEALASATKNVDVAVSQNFCFLYNKKLVVAEIRRLQKEVRPRVR
jgi:hypothetical protein